MYTSNELKRNVDPVDPVGGNEAKEPSSDMAHVIEQLVACGHDLVACRNGSFGKRGQGSKNSQELCDSKGCTVTQFLLKYEIESGFECFG